MTSKKVEKPTIKSVYNTTLALLKSKSIIFIPFIIFTVLELIALICVYIAPRQPFSLVFGPPIKAFFGEKFLHYPLNFILYPKLVSLNRIWLSIIFGSFLSGAAVSLVFYGYNKKPIRLKESFSIAVKKYAFLFIIVLISILIFHLLVKLITAGLIKYFLSGHSKLLFLKPYIWMTHILITFNFILAIFVQAALAYAMPLIIIEKEGFFRSIFRSLVLFKDLFFPTLILVGLPMLLYIPILLLDYNALSLINRFFPEVIFIVSLLGILINSLVIDPLVTVSTTVMFLKFKENKEKS